MQWTASGPSLPLLVFAAATTAVYGVALAFAGRLASVENPGPVAMGITLDLAIVVPAVFHFVVIRRTRVPAVTLVPLVVLSLIMTARILPPEHHRTLNMLETLAIPLELGLIAWVMWRATPHVPAGTTPFTHHERSGYGGIVLGLLMLLAVEGVAVHLLLMQWSGLAAWLFTLSTLYGTLWVIADYRATVLRPILLGEHSLILRAGLRTTMRVPLAAIDEITRQEPESPHGRIKLSFIGEPTHWITLKQPMVAEGMFGSTRRVRFVGLEPDHAEALVARLNSVPGEPTGDPQ